VAAIMNASSYAKDALWPGVGRTQVAENESVLNHAHPPMLGLNEISVSFDGFKALNRLSLSIGPGELRCIIGPNGAGKTTLMDVMTGKTRPDSGEVTFEGGLDLTRLSEPQIAQLGIGRKFQKPTVFENHTVFENLELAMSDSRRVWDCLWAKPTPKKCARIDAQLAMVGLTEEAQKQAGLLSHGQKQWLEIGMLLIQEPKLLLLDEPVAGMSDQERERTALLLKSLEGKHSIVVVEHDMDFVESIAKKVTVLHEGAVLAEGPMSSVKNNQKVIEVYLGR
jgi:urea transport system ATP-binding protein